MVFFIFCKAIFINSLKTPEQQLMIFKILAIVLPYSRPPRLGYRSFLTVSIHGWSRLRSNCALGTATMLIPKSKLALQSCLIV